MDNIHTNHKCVHHIQVSSTYDTCLGSFSLAIFLPTSEAVSLGNARRTHASSISLTRTMLLVKAGYYKQGARDKAEGCLLGFAEREEMRASEIGLQTWDATGG